MDMYAEFLNDNIIEKYFEDNEDTNVVKDTRRAIRRKNNFAKARRKRNIDKSVHNGIHPWYSNLHQYSKNKIHCSCPLCAFNHKKHGYKNRTIKEIKQLDNMNNQEKEFYNEV